MEQSEFPQTRGERLNYFGLITTDKGMFLTIRTASLWMAFTAIGKPEIDKVIDKAKNHYAPELLRAISEGRYEITADKLIKEDDVLNFMGSLMPLYDFRMWLSFIPDGETALTDIPSAIKSAKSEHVKKMLKKAQEFHYENSRYPEGRELFNMGEDAHGYKDWDAFRKTFFRYFSEGG